MVTAAKDMDHISYKEGIHHVVYPLLDGKQEDIAVFFDNFYEIVQKNLQKGSVLVHCAAGVSRVFQSINVELHPCDFVYHEEIKNELQRSHSTCQEVKTLCFAEFGL